jgi:hypothetical protein
MKYKEDTGCLTAAMLATLCLFAIFFMREQSMNANRKIPTPTPFLTITAVWTGPSYKDCLDEDDQRLAELCWDEIIKLRDDMQQSKHSPQPDNLPDDPMEQDGDPFFRIP